MAIIIDPGFNIFEDQIETRRTVPGFFGKKG